MIQIGGTRIPMQEQKVQERIKNFYSVPLGYTEKEVVAEAQRCILCKDAPCEKFCPVNMKIRDMIRKVAERDFKQAFLIAKEDNAIPAIAGRVCPQE
ncbi:MAG: dihydropyrimidine dehydrogenase, partial [Candidatus Cloacimonetes bacterium]|nr:dihydropyrimidine dehydrogenase [Candidatus Cloacimonadota bacterium]